MKNYYEILEVNKKASKEVIEKAYKVLVKKYHPDVHANQKRLESDKKIKEINEAYEVLSNDFLRAQYDIEIQREEMNSKSSAKEKKVTAQKEVEEFNQNMKRHKVGTFSGAIELLKEIYQNKSKRQEIKEITRQDIIAIILTIIVIAVMGVILWYIPFTNGWMRELLFENPIFNWISGLFNSK